MGSFSSHYGHWGLALIMVIIASWVFYHYAAPKNWKEWRGAGLVQAFIIALYAEMYGFPLTIYLLTRVLGIDIPLTGYTGHLWATLLGYGAVGAMAEMAIGWTFVILGLALLIEGWREVYWANRYNRLETTGVYGVVRHPQYSGIFLALFGQLIHWPTVITLALFPVIVWMYVRLARSEERDLVRKYDDQYREYQRRVPMFFPSVSRWPDLLYTLRRQSSTVERRDKAA